MEARGEREWRISGFLEHPAAPKIATLRHRKAPGLFTGGIYMLYAAHDDCFVPRECEGLRGRRALGEAQGARPAPGLGKTSERLVRKKSDSPRGFARVACEHPLLFPKIRSEISPALYVN